MRSSFRLVAPTHQHHLHHLQLLRPTTTTTSKSVVGVSSSLLLLRQQPCSYNNAGVGRGLLVATDVVALGLGYGPSYQIRHCSSSDHTRPPTTPKPKLETPAAGQATHSTSPPTATSTPPTKPPPRTVKEDALHPKKREVTDELLSKIMVQEDARLAALETDPTSDGYALRTPKDVFKAFSDSEFVYPGATRILSSSAFPGSGSKQPYQVNPYRVVDDTVRSHPPPPASGPSVAIPHSANNEGSSSSTSASPTSTISANAAASPPNTTGGGATIGTNCPVDAACSAEYSFHEYYGTTDSIKAYEEGLYSTLSPKQVGGGRPSVTTNYPIAERRTEPVIVKCPEVNTRPSAEDEYAVDMGPTPSVWDVYKRFGHHLWPKDRWDLKGRLLLAFFCVGMTKVLKVSVPVIFKTIVDALVVVNPHTAAAVSAVAATSSSAAAATASTAGLPIIAFVAAYGLTKLSASFFSEVAPVAFSKIGSTAANEVSMEVFRKLHQLDLAFHNNKTVGGLQKEIERGTRAFGSLAKAILFVMIPTILELVLASAVLYYHAGLPLVALAFTSLVAYVLHTVHTSRWRSKFPKAFNRQDTELSKVAVDSLINYEAVKIFNNEEFEAKRISRINSRINRTVQKIDYSLGLLHFGQQAIFVVAVTACLAVTTSMVGSGALSIGDMVLIDSLLLQLFSPLTTLGAVYRDASNAAINMQSVLSLLRRKDESEDDVALADFVPSSMSIEFRNVSYRVDDKLILDNVSFVIPGGSTVAFVGPSGCGKSTIVRMLYRFVEPTEGEILVDGQPLTAVTRDSYRRHVSMVPQDTSLFNDTIRHNIRYGNIEASDAEVEEAALAANVHNRIMSMPCGYDTEVGDRGLKLSGGEKQRVAIARCLLKRAPLLLADEFSSALDTHTEGNVMRILKGGNNSINGNSNGSCGGSSTASSSGGSSSFSDSIITSVVIAHRLNVIRDADAIFVLNQHGQLIERGTHEELMAITEGNSSATQFSDLDGLQQAAVSPNHSSALMHVVDPEEEDDFPGQYRRMWINQHVSPN